jgi:hypothetical protein
LKAFDLGLSLTFNGLQRQPAQFGAGRDLQMEYEYRLMMEETTLTDAACAVEIRCQQFQSQHFNWYRCAPSNTQKKRLTETASAKGCKTAVGESVFELTDISGEAPPESNSIVLLGLGLAGVAGHLTPNPECKKN